MKRLITNLIIDGLIFFCGMLAGAAIYSGSHVGH